MGAIFRDKSEAGFTLLELLVVVAIIGMLTGVAVAAWSSVNSSGQRVKEVHSIKRLVEAYLQFPIENDGRLLPGYDRTVSEVTLPDGMHAAGPAASRYPFRIAPYLGNEFRGTILAGKNLQQIDASSSYHISLSPSFAMNYLYVGGDIAANGARTVPDECVTHIGSASRILVFLSGGSSSGSGNDVIEGFNIATPPKIYTDMWVGEGWNEHANPGNYGNVHARHEGRAVVAFLDGSVESLTIEDLRDMRLWNRNAVMANNPNYTITPAPRPGGRR